MPLVPSIAPSIAPPCLRASVPPCLPSAPQGQRARPGFTLTELLVVIGIIVLLVTMAMPAWRLIGGENSIDAAQNQVSALLGRARTDALALQEGRGVMFYREADTGRVGAVIVRQRPEMVTSTGRGQVIDVLPDRDGLLLPVGIDLQAFVGAAAANGVRSSDGYLGYNKPAASEPLDSPLGPVIMFDSKGKLDSREYQVVAATGGQWTAAGDVLYDTRDPSDANKKRAAPSSLILSPGTIQSQIGVVLFDHAGFVAAGGTDEDTVGGSYATEQAEETWIDSNARQFLINRYNGTLIRAGDRG
jgi:prepilin-type N-terminal cleavage/methylation domain-containing protein